MGERLSGDLFYLEFDGTNLRTSAKSFNKSHSLNESDATVGTDEYETKIATKKKIEVTADIVVFEKSSVIGAAQRSKLELGSEANLLWGPEGNASGKPKGGFLARLVQADEKYSVGDTAMFSCKWSIVSGTLLFDDRTDTWT